MGFSQTPLLLCLFPIDTIPFLLMWMSNFPTFCESLGGVIGVGLPGIPEDEGYVGVVGAPALHGGTPGQAQRPNLQLGAYDPGIPPYDPNNVAYQGFYDPYQVMHCLL